MNKRDVRRKLTLGELFGLSCSSANEGFSSAFRVIQNNLTLSNRVPPELVEVFLFTLCSGRKAEPV